MERVIYSMIRLGDYFTIIRGNAKNLTDKQSSTDIEAVRLLSATSDNNGGSKFVIPQSDETVYSNTITINNNGSVGYVFYHPYKFIASSDVTIIVPTDKHELNENTALFLKSAIEKQQDKFAYGYKISNDRLKNLLIHVPLIDDSSINWEKMESVISDIRQDLLTVPTTKNDLDGSLDLNSKKWGQFKVSDILTVDSGVRLTKENMTKGDTPFIGASANGNGITNWVANENKSLDSNVLGVNYNGSVVDNFYHPYTALFSDDVKRIHIKDKTVDANVYKYMFLKVAFLQHKEQYQYGYKFDGNRMRNQKLVLPTDDNGNPDWKFMEDYIKSLPNGDLV